ncbi:hypothetical protein BGZ61DRAFT_448231 [Ilyonectria robusta]|uniref:uncharacterized protein n=1 Tax=Ilyonectria robusta TaxID=1079257 RepID=UPI001E8D88F7|nr:uncharacterized protein BGZ61DRAFT_448231 [Ilyonectria robusta]KAH8722220.1 hypothetical protein BGZ61DRAFT_448231 [Ilyonectria robusta]
MSPFQKYVAISVVHYCLSSFVLRPPCLVELSSLRCSPELGNQPTTPMLAAQRCTSQRPRIAPITTHRHCNSSTSPKQRPQALSRAHLTHPTARDVRPCATPPSVVPPHHQGKQSVRLLRCRALPLLLQFAHNVIDGMAHGTEWLVWFRFSRYRRWVTAGCRCGVVATLFRSRSSLMHAAVRWFLVPGLLAIHSCLHSSCVNLTRAHCPAQWIVGWEAL